MFWPLGTTIAGRNYEETAIMAVGIVGLILTAVGIMVVISLLPIMFSLPPLRA